MKKKRILFEAGRAFGLSEKDVRKMEPLSDEQVDLIMNAFEVHINLAAQMSKDKDILRAMDFNKKSLNTVYTIIKDAQQVSKTFAKLKRFVHKV